MNKTKIFVEKFGGEMCQKGMKRSCLLVMHVVVYRVNNGTCISDLLPCQPQVLVGKETDFKIRQIFKRQQKRYVCRMIW